MAEVHDAIEMLQAARRILTQSHDVEDTSSPLVQRPNWAMRATNAIDEALSECAAEARAETPMLVDNDWLRRKIATTPDVECEARPATDREAQSK